MGASGLTRERWAIGLPLAMAVALAFAACSQGGPAPTSTPPATATALPPTATAVVTPTAAATTPAVDPIEWVHMLRDVGARGLRTAETFSVDVSVSITAPDRGDASPLMTFEATGVYQAPDRTRLDTTVTTTLPGVAVTLSTRMIAIGDTFYTIDPRTGAWNEDLGPIPAFLPAWTLMPWFAIDTFAGTYTTPPFEDLRGLGQEIIDDKPVQRVTGMTGASGERITVDLWVDTADSVLRKSVVRTEEPRFDEPLFDDYPGGPLVMTVTIEYDDFDQPVAPIEAPVPP